MPGCGGVKEISDLESSGSPNISIKRAPIFLPGFRSQRSQCFPLLILAAQLLSDALVLRAGLAFCD